MKNMPRKLTLEGWDDRYAQLVQEGLREPHYGGTLRRHVTQEGDLRLRVGDYRVRFTEDGEEIRVHAVNNRKDAYR